MFTCSVSSPSKWTCSAACATGNYVRILHIKYMAYVLERYTLHHVMTSVQHGSMGVASWVGTRAAGLYY